MGSKIDLYFMPLSSPSRAALMTAKNIGVPINQKFTNILAGDQLKPEYLKVALAASNRYGSICFEST
jgi:hypothetical protein